MAVDRDLAEDLARVLVELYGGLADRLSVDLARMLAAGIDRPDWATRKQAAANEVRQVAEQLIARLDTELAGQVEQMLVLAHQRGGQAALDELGRLAGATPEQLAAIRAALPGAEAVQRLAWSLTSTLRGTHLRILRWSLDVYRDVVARASAEVLLGTATRRQAAQRAWEQLLSKGVTGFVDRSGRGWELQSYVEMATRSTVAQAAVEGHLDRLAGAGIDLVIVSNAPQECPRCRPWEGKVLARSGPTGTIQVQHATQDRPITITVAGTIGDATGAGLMHPNCRHSLSAYLPGVTIAPKHTADPEGDRARQELRRLEREVRKHKRIAAAAIDPDAARQAEARVRDLQAQIRAHVDETGLHRQRPREQIGVAR